jgi:periplasmic protein TonB
MFEQSFVSSGKTRRSWTVLVAFAGQVLAIGLLLAIPLLFVQSLPIAQFTSVLLAAPPPPPLPPPPPPAAVHVAKASHPTTTRKFDMSQLIAPKTVPKQVASVSDIQELAPPSPSAAGVPGGVAGGVPGGVLGGVLGGLPSAAPPPPPPPKADAPKPATPTRVRMGGQVEAAKLIHEVQPEYPVLARDARIGGTVRLQAIISRDGKVQDLTLLSGQPLLVQAAMEAVKQWVYQPTYLNGTAVEVLTEVDVHFRLST